MLDGISKHFSTPFAILLSILLGTDNDALRTMQVIGESHPANLNG